MNNLVELTGLLTKLVSDSNDGPLLVAICGAADLGKTHLSKKLVSALENNGISAGYLTLDSYLMDREKRVTQGISGYQPEAYDIRKIKRDIIGYLKGDSIEFLPYDHAKGKACLPKSKIYQYQVLILDGLHSMHPEIKQHLGLSIFIHVSDELHISIRHNADRQKRKQSVAFSNRNLRNELNAYKFHIVS